jgi:hypothetical protein
MLTSPAAPDEAPPLHTDTLPLLPALPVPDLNVHTPVWQLLLLAVITEHPCLPVTT